MATQQISKRQRLSKVIFRLTPEQHKNLKKALIEYDIGIQHLCEAITELALENNLPDKLKIRAKMLAVEGRRKW